MLLILAASSFAAETTALDAIKLLPKEQRKRVARIEARDGTPVPERWHILVADPSVENGLKEFVVADGVVVAERTISQFAESLTPEQALGDVVKFDSNRAAKLAEQFAQVNAVTAATIDYQLRKDGPTAVPLWRLTCSDENGKEVGSLTLTATKGAVISHQGFAVEPSENVGEKVRERFRTDSGSQVTRERGSRSRQPAPPPKKPGLFQRIFGGGNQPPER